MQNTFSFIGTFSRPKEDAKRPFYHAFEKNGRKMRSLNFGVRPNQNNIGFVEMFGSEQSVIKARDRDNNPIEIDWDDRFDPDVLKNVSTLRVVDLGPDYERKEFLSEYDAIEYLKDNLNENLPPLVYSGRLQKQLYQGKVFDKFQLQNVFPVTPDKSGKIPSPKLRANIDLVYNKDCVDMSDWKEKKIIYVDGYTPTYIDKDHGTKYIPQRLVLNATKIDPKNDLHMAQLNFRMKFITTVGKKMVSLGWETVLLNGAETVEFDESMLTGAQRESIECGLKTLEDYRPRGQIFGERINEYRMTCPYLSYKDYINGFVDLDQNFDEWEQENVYIPPKEETLADVMEEPKKEEPKSAASDFDPEELFV